MKKLVSAILGSVLSAAAGLSSLHVQALPAEFQKELIFSVPQQVATVKFSPNDDRIFVGEKSGIIRVYKNKFDTAPTVAVDLSNEIYKEVDHGLLGLEVHPNFPATPVIFALYTHAYGVNAARLKRITLNPTTNVAVSQQLLYEGWCNQSTTHSVGDLNFHADLSAPQNPIYTLYMTVGDMASPGKVDLGQTDNCGAADVNIGALRSQLFRTSNNTQTNYNGTLTRLGEAEFMSNTQLNKLNIAAYGLRNPFRFTVQPNTGEIYIAEVGWNNTEEINYVPAPRTDEVVENFGWPCFEGGVRQGGYQGANTPACNSLYAANSDTKPFWEYPHNGGQAAATGAAVYTGNLYPAQYKNGLFIADYSQFWIRFIPATDNGKPNKNTSFAAAAFDAGSPVIQLESGPLGDIYYLSYNLNNNKFELWRIKSAADPQTIASATADSNFVLPNNDVTITASNSFVASGSARYEWDLNADGIIDLSENTGVQTVKFANVGEYTVSVRVADKTNLANRDTVSIPVIVTESIPQPAIAHPEPGLTWATGDIIDLDGGLAPGSAPAASFSWNVLISHCAKNDPTDCHLHDDISRAVPVSTFVAPDHEYPSHLNAKLCATGFPGPVDGWFNAAWASRRLVSVDTSDLTSQTLFKVLVDLTPADIDYASAGANGKSLRFVNKAGVVLPHKINTWNTQGTSTVWLQYPAVTGGRVSNSVWMYYGNASAGDGQDLGVAFPAAAQNSDRVSISAAQAAQQTLKACEIVPLQPRLANIVMASNPNGLQTTFGSTTAVWAAPIPSIIGSTATISAPLSQVKDAHQFDFLNWSHGGGRLQEFITPNQAQVTLTANYNDAGVIFAPCIFPTMNLRGLFNNWLSAPMKMVAQCTWGATIDVVGAANTQVKFDVANNWVTNFGDTNADGIAEQAGGNITIPGGAGRYDVTFNDQTKAYKVVKVVVVASSSVASSSVASSSVESSSAVVASSVAVVSSSVASSVASAPASIFHLRGTHNGWLVGDFFAPVVGSATNFEICRNFAAGDANGGPRFKVDPNGGWGADAFPAADVPANGWTKIVINGTTRVLVSTTINMPVNCGVVASSSSVASSSIAVASSSVASSSVVSSSVASSSVVSSSEVSSSVASSSEAAVASSSMAVASSSLDTASSSLASSSVASSIASSSIASSSVASSIASSSSVASSSAPAVASVKFTCNNGTTVAGQNVYVVGSTPQLGSWVTTAAVKLSPTAYPSWTGTVVLPASTAITWKCIKINGAAVVWQGGANNAVTTPATGTLNATATF